MRVISFLVLLFMLAVSHVSGLIVEGLPKAAPKPASTSDVKTPVKTQNQVTTGAQPVKR